MSEPFHGVLPALITPFTDDGDAIDPQALATIVDRLVGAGVGGLVPGGSTGEFTTLTNAERRQLVEVTVEAAGGRVPVVPRTGAPSTRETIELSVHAEQAGAAAVMIVPPYYDALSWRELLAHYTAVADVIEIPIMYYNLPSASGVKPTAAQLRELPVAWLKDTDLPAARELWTRLWPLCQFLEGQSYPAAVKAACRLVGDATGPTRAPLLPLDGAATRELPALLEHA